MADQGKNMKAWPLCPNSITLKGPSSSRAPHQITSPSLGLFSNMSPSVQTSIFHLPPIGVNTEHPLIKIFYINHFYFWDIQILAPVTRNGMIQENKC